MASIDQFEDHCWKDVVPEDDMRIYAPYARETAVGPMRRCLHRPLQPGLRGRGETAGRDCGAISESSCGIYAHRADRADQTVDRGRTPRRAADILLHPGCAQQCAPVRRVLDQAQAAAS